MSCVIGELHYRLGLLPGDLDDCLDPTNATDPTCVGGSAAAASVIRHSIEEEEGPAFHFPKLDRESRFVAMHPEGWGVNRLVLHDYFGWEFFNAPPSLLTDENRLGSVNLLTPNFRPTITNVALSPSSMWFQFLEHIHVDEDTGAAFIYIQGESQPLTTPAVKSMVSALDYVAYVNANNGCFDKISGGIFSADRIVNGTSPCLIPIVYYLDEPLRDEMLDSIRVHPNPPLVLAQGFGEMDPEIVNNQTLVVAIDISGGLLSHLSVDVDLENWAVKNFTFNEIDFEELPSKYKDDQYFRDMEYLRILADEALANDPVVGTSGFMPLTRTVIDTDWRMCMGGECPIGNLFTDALRWAADADFAVVSSGGLRGEGWEAGEVHVSDIWSALPFMNDICIGVMSGVSVFSLLNYSTAVATFESTYTPMGDRLLQMSGLRITYNTQLPGSGNGRLISIDIWDMEKNEFLPLERLKLYRFATENWMCDSFDPFPSFFKDNLRMEGEVRGTVDDSRSVQEVVGAYLSYLSDKGISYDTSLKGSHINDTRAFEPMSFIETPESCLKDYFWETEILTCMPCPGVNYVEFSDDLISFLVTPHSEDLSGRNVLSNHELFNVTLAARLIPEWLLLKGTASNLTKGSTLLQPGDSIAVDFDIDPTGLSKGSTRSIVSFGVILDGDYPGCLTDLDIAFETVVEVRAEENFNHLGAIRMVGFTFMALAMALAVFFFFWTHRNKKHRIVQMSQPKFLELICVGTFMMASCIIPLSVDDGVASVRGCDIACMSAPWLLLMGFGITLSALFAKIWRVNTVVSNAMAFRRVVILERDAMMPIAVVFALNFTLLLCWTLIDPMRWQREYINGDPTNSYGFCKSEGKASIAFLVLLILLNGAALVQACVQSYYARNMDDEYAESRWIGIACLSWLQVMVVGIPVILLTSHLPVAKYFTSCALVFLVCMSMLLLLFVPKIKAISKPLEAQTSGFQHRQSQVCRPHLAPVYNTEITEIDKGIQLRQRVQELESTLEE
ncbi:hypothetical protein HJC23_001505 [Cyclotella cryptica]|uniref:G-protein coupled receptors family 3 profile domain-containing protein n=1 Tax=Cyclotella cryptica TaxID=29204 RepID=A0ABD3NLD5_9STRA